MLIEILMFVPPDQVLLTGLQPVWLEYRQCHRVVHLGGHGAKCQSTPVRYTSCLAEPGSECLLLTEFFGRVAQHPQVYIIKLPPVAIDLLRQNSRNQHVAKFITMEINLACPGKCGGGVTLAPDNTLVISLDFLRQQNRALVGMGALEFDDENYAFNDVAVVHGDAMGACR